MHPEFEDEDAVNPFDFWEGANFRLRIRQVEGYRNYDKSDFDTPSALLDDDEALESLWQTQHGLAELIAPDKFKSYAELETRLARVLGHSPQSTPEATQAVEEEAPWQPPQAESKAAEESPTASVILDDDDLSLEFFMNLAES
jgi:hypothetical protein